MKQCIQDWFRQQMPDADDSLIGEIYAEYRDTARRLFAELVDQRAARAEFAVVDRTAHTLKGNALMVGDNALFEAVQAWRAAIKAYGVDAAESLWPPVEAAMATID